jgi:hypothetical protein
MNTTIPCRKTSSFQPIREFTPPRGAHIGCLVAGGSQHHWGAGERAGPPCLTLALHEPARRGILSSG